MSDLIVAGVAYLRNRLAAERAADAERQAAWEADAEDRRLEEEQREREAARRRGAERLGVEVLDRLATFKRRMAPGAFELLRPARRPAAEQRPPVPAPASLDFGAPPWGSPTNWLPRVGERD